MGAWFVKNCQRNVMPGARRAGRDAHPVAMRWTTARIGVAN
jgi:hypothetical protein